MKPKLIIGDIVRVLVATDDSGNAADMFGCEPQNSWFVTSFYPELVYAKITRVKGRIEGIKGYMEKGVFYPLTKTLDLSKGGREKEMEYARYMIKEVYNIPEEEFFEEMDGDTWGEFLKVEKINTNQ